MVNSNNLSKLFPQRRQPGPVGKDQSYSVLFQDLKDRVRQVCIPWEFNVIVGIFANVVENFVICSWRFSRVLPLLWRDLGKTLLENLCAYEANHSRLPWGEGGELDYLIKKDLSRLPPTHKLCAALTASTIYLRVRNDGAWENTSQSADALSANTRSIFGRLIRNRYLNQELSWEVRLKPFLIFILSTFPDAVLASSETKSTDLGAL